MDTTIGLFVFLASVMLSMTLIPVLVRVAPASGLMDYPNARKVHEGGIPRVGGIAIFVSSLIPLLIWLPETDLAIPILIGLSTLFLFGVLDDRNDLNYKLKFIGQIIAASVVVYFGDVVIVRYPFIEGYEIPIGLAKVITVISLVGITNAINLSDGLDGLAAGTSLLVIGCMMVIAYFAQDSIVFFFSLAILGATIGFLRFNSHPALIFLGDSGSQLLGFCAGLIAILISQKSNTALIPMLPVVALGLPILDTLLVMTKRLSEGRSPFSADKNHIHHRLLYMGFSHHTAVIIIYAAQTSLVITAYQLRYTSDALLFSVYLVFCLSLFLATSTRHSLFPQRLVNLITRVVDLSDVNKNPALFRWLSFRIAGVLLVCVFVIGPLCVDDITPDFGVASFIMLCAIFIAVIKKLGPSLMIVRLCLFTVAMFSIYFLEKTLDSDGIARSFFNAYFVALGMLVALIIRFWDRNQFGFSALDYLTVTAALIVPLIIDISIIGTFGRFIILESLILFYSIDALFNRSDRFDNTVLISAVTSLFIITARAFI